MSNVLLISPPEQHLLMEAGDRPNMGILYLAGALRRKGHYPIISDLNHDSYKELNQKARMSDFIGMTTFTPYFNWVTNFSKHLKQNYPNKPLIGGGPHATTQPESLVHFDYVVQGEGEKAIVDIVSNKVKKKIMFYPFEQNLDNLPYPHDELHPSNYGMTQDGYRTMTIMSSRSCNYACFFCTKGILGKAQRFKSLNRVLKEMESLQNKGFNSFYFLDDTFTQNRQRSLNFAQEIIDRKWNITYRAGTRTDKVDLELLTKLRESGMRSISFGLEHMDNYVLKKVKKANTVENHMRAIKQAKQVGLKVRGSFIINCPGATEQTVKKTLNKAKELDIDYADFYALIAYPKTPIWNRPDLFEAEIDKSYDFNQTSNLTNVSFKNMKPDLTRRLVDKCRAEWAKHKGLLCPWETKPRW